MRLIGRRAEQRELRRCEKTAKSELVCVYGRRRVGKTYLVEQTFFGQFAFRATGVEGATTRQQLRSFNQRLQQYGDSVRTIPHDWFEAFSRLETILNKESTTRSSRGKLIVFFDEFPWFATPKSDFLMAFGEFWNRCGTSRGDYFLIICGSATSWIIGNILENTGSLYNRVTCQIHLEPFNLHDTEQLLAEHNLDWPRKQIAESHMVFGGLPYYYDLLDSDQSLGQNIDRLCLAPHALLGNESRMLLESTLRKSPVYNQILGELAKHRYGMPKQKCFESLSIPSGTFSRAVTDLVRCGYVAQYKNSGQAQKPLHLELSDPFLLFHYAFLDQRDDLRRWDEIVSDHARFVNWRGHAFELLCLSHIWEIKESLGIAGVKTSTFPWTSSKGAGGAQIDLVIQRDDGITNLCEMKYTDRPFAITASYEENLLRKCEVYREEAESKHALRLVMVSASGVSGTAHTDHLSCILTLDDLFDYGVSGRHMP